MGRWQPDARGRLEQAAMELYRERGFDNTTVAEIAERAGLTERTFFRHYADKREVLFGGSNILEDMLVRKVDEAPAAMSPMEAIVAALTGIATEIFEERHEFAQQRQAIIAANTELRERELIKLASLATATAEALRRRGVSDPAASLAAEAGMAIFKIAFDRWVNAPGQRPLSDIIQDSMLELSAMTTPGPSATSGSLARQGL